MVSQESVLSEKKVVHMQTWTIPRGPTKTSISTPRAALDVDNPWSSPLTANAWTAGGRTACGLAMHRPPPDPTTPPVAHSLPKQGGHCWTPSIIVRLKMAQMQDLAAGKGIESCAGTTRRPA